MALEKYVGKVDLVETAIHLVREFNKNGVPALLAGSVASVAIGKKKDANDIDIYIPANYKKYNGKIREIATKFGFKENEKYRKECEGWQNIQQFYRYGGGSLNGQTNDIWLDIFFHPVLLNPDFVKKIDEGRYYVKIKDNGDNLVLIPRKIIGGREA